MSKVTYTKCLAVSSCDMWRWSTIGFVLFSLLGLLARKAVNGDWETVKEKQTQLYTATWHPLGGSSSCDGFPGQFVVSQLCTSYFPYCYDNIISYQQLQGCFISGSQFVGVINPRVGSLSMCNLQSGGREREGRLVLSLLLPFGSVQDLGPWTVLLTYRTVLPTSANPI